MKKKFFSNLNIRHFGQNLHNAYLHLNLIQKCKYRWDKEEKEKRKKDPYFDYL